VVIDFTLDIVPHGKGRPRAASIGGKARMFTPAKTRNWEASFSLLARKHRPEELMTGPLRVSITAFFPRPQKMSKRSKRTGELLGGFSEGPIPMASRPDADNVAKAVLDALASWYRDDAQVFYLVVTKFYHAVDARPRVRVTIEEVE
jgi:Holliday junction resolvase RusA-like endonuclease